MNDRFEELGFGQLRREGDIENDVGDVELEESRVKIDDGFHDRVDKAKTLLREIKRDCKALKRRYATELQKVARITTSSSGEESNKPSPFAEQRKVISEKLKRMKDEILALGRIVKKLEREKEEKRHLRIEYLLRKKEYESLLTRTRKVADNFRMMESRYRDDRKEEIKRKLRIVKDEDEIGEEEVVKFMKNPQHIFQMKLNGSRRMTVKHHYDQAVETRNDLLDLENNFNEVMEMFTDVHLLLADQDENIQSIEDNIETAIVKVDQGKQAIRRGRGNRGKSRKLVVIAIILAIVLFVLCVVVILIFLFGLGAIVATIAAALGIRIDRARS